MRFIRKISYCCAKKLTKTHAERIVYCYSLNLIFGAIIKGVALLLVSLILGILKPILVVAATFSILRAFAGGFHFDNFNKCMFITLTMFVAATYLVKHIYTHSNCLILWIMIFIVFTTCFYTILKYAPQDNINKPLESFEEVKKFKSLSAICLIVLLLICAGLTALNFYLYALAVMLGVALEVFSLSPAGNKFFARIDKI